MNVQILSVPQPLEFVEVWTLSPHRAASMDQRRDICDENAGKPVAEVGHAPAHPNCDCGSALVLKEQGN